MNSVCLAGFFISLRRKSTYFRSSSITEAAAGAHHSYCCISSYFHVRTDCVRLVVHKTPAIESRTIRAYRRLSDTFTFIVAEPILSRTLLSCRPGFSEVVDRSTSHSVSGNQVQPNCGNLLFGTTSSIGKIIISTPKGWKKTRCVILPLIRWGVPRGPRSWPVPLGTDSSDRPLAFSLVPCLRYLSRPVFNSRV